MATGFIGHAPAWNWYLTGHVIPPSQKQCMRVKFIYRFPLAIPPAVDDLKF